MGNKSPYSNDTCAFIGIINKPHSAFQNLFQRGQTTNKYNDKVGQFCTSLPCFSSLGLWLKKKGPAAGAVTRGLHHSQITSTAQKFKEKLMKGAHSESQQRPA